MNDVIATVLQLCFFLNEPCCVFPFNTSVLLLGYKGFMFYSKQNPLFLLFIFIFASINIQLSLLCTCGYLFPLWIDALSYIIF